LSARAAWEASDVESVDEAEMEPVRGCPCARDVICVCPCAVAAGWCV
jgi:hypothetical protein